MFVSETDLFAYDYSAGGVGLPFQAEMRSQLRIGVIIDSLGYCK